MNFGKADSIATLTNYTHFPMCWAFTVLLSVCTGSAKHRYIYGHS